MMTDFRERRKLTRALLLGGMWLGIGVVFATQLLFFDARVRQSMTWTDVLFFEIPRWGLWGLLAPLIQRTSHRYPLSREPRWRNLLSHAALSALFSFAHLVLLTVATVVIDIVWYKWPSQAIVQFSEKILPLLLTRFDLYFYLTFHVGIIVYWVIVIVQVAMDYYRRSARLETQLANAKLDALKMQLHPHFLFNTLTAIAELMHIDVEKADRMITRLSDLLRTSLEETGTHQVPLKQELEFLERYLEIEKIRFGDRLLVSIDADTAVTDARVPQFLMQPIVENAIRHGVGTRADQGRLEILAHMEDGHLRLSVQDNGPGIHRQLNDVLDKGVGLRNTRARLEQLYGEMYRLDIRNRPEGGLAVDISIPFQAGAEK